MGGPQGKVSRIPVGGLVLVALGVLLLLQTTGVVAWGVWGALVRLWPVLLIIAGVQLVLGKRAPLIAAASVAVLLAGAIALAALIGPAAAGMRTLYVNEPLGIIPVTRMDVDVDFGAGSLHLRALPADSPLLSESTQVMPGRDPIAAVERVGGTATLRYAPGEAGIFAIPFGWGDNDANWDIALARGIPVALNLDIGAADADVDLSALDVEQLTVNVGAADLDVTLPAQGRLSATVKGGAADITIVVPQGVAARIVSTSGFSSISVDEGRFPKGSTGWESPDYAGAEHRVDLSITVGAASVNVR